MSAVQEQWLPTSSSSSTPITASNCRLASSLSLSKVKGQRSREESREEAECRVGTSEKAPISAGDVTLVKGLLAVCSRCTDVLTMLSCSFSSNRSIERDEDCEAEERDIAKRS